MYISFHVHCSGKVSCLYWETVPFNVLYKYYINFRCIFNITDMRSHYRLIISKYHSEFQIYMVELKEKKMSLTKGTNEALCIQKITLIVQSAARQRAVVPKHPPWSLETAHSLILLNQLCTTATKAIIDVIMRPVQVQIKPLMPCRQTAEHVFSPPSLLLSSPVSADHSTETRRHQSRSVGAAGETCWCEATEDSSGEH